MLFNIFTHDPDDGIENTLTKFDTKVGDKVDMLEGRAILETWTGWKSG